MEETMKDESSRAGSSKAGGSDIAAQPAVVDRATWQAELDTLLVREKAHTREGDAIAAARRRRWWRWTPPSRWLARTGRSLLDVFEVAGS
jgi:predicted dithiol-disulfide oxidoreductase (DUF899 family)